ncbi:MAG: hypothetical protein ACI9MC_002436, partial [Kiritimatiellia bacterium]
KTFEDFIYLTETVKGELSCYAPGDAWNTQTVDESKIQMLAATSANIEDFQDDTPVPEATLLVWFDDVAGGAPDSDDVSDQSGKVTLDLPTCTSVAYKTATDPALEATIDTYEAHQIFGADGEIQPFLSVSMTTYKLIPGILGLKVDPGHAVIAGSIYGCDGQKVENAQVVVKHKGTDDISQEGVVKYFEDEFPNRGQKWTSADGLWNAINVTDGEYVVEAWIYDGAEHVQIGATEVKIVPDSINISNIYVGFGNGVRYPDSCLAQ